MTETKENRTCTKKVAVTGCPPPGITVVGSNHGVRRTVTWNNVRGAEAYQLEFNKVCFCSDADRRTQKIYGNTFDLLGLEYGQKYSVRVAGINAAGLGVFSDYKYFETGLQSPSEVKLSVIHGKFDVLHVEVKENDTRPPLYKIIALSSTSFVCGRSEPLFSKEPFVDIKIVKPGETYTVCVESVDSNKQTLSERTYSNTIQAYCAKVSNLRQEEAGHITSIEWNHAENAHGYLVTCCVGAEEVARKQQRGVKYYPGELKHSTLYRFYVSAVNSAGIGPESEISIFKQVPLPPTNVTVSHSLDFPESSLVVQFQGEQKACKFILTPCGQSPDDEIGRVTVHQTPALIKNLNPGARYKIRIEAISEETGAKSDATWSPYIEMLPDKPQVAIDTEVLQPTQRRVTWKSLRGAASYEIRHRIMNGQWVKEQTRETEKLLKDLEPGRIYEVQVTAINNMEKMGKPSTVKFVTVPPKPTNVRVSMLSTTQVSVRWDCLETATKYHFRIVDKESSDCAYSLGSMPFSTTDPKFTVALSHEELPNGKSCYRFNVKTSDHTKLKTSFDGKNVECTSTRPQFFTQICSGNAEGCSAPTQPQEINLDLLRMREHFHNKAKKGLPRELYISTLTDFQHIEHRESAVLFNGETILVVGTQLSGKTSFCMSYIQKLGAEFIAIYIDFESQEIKEIEQFMAAELNDIFSKDIIQSLVEWMKENSEHIVFVFDNADILQSGANISQFFKEHRCRFPKSQIICTTTRADLRHAIGATHSYRLRGIGQKGIEEMRKVVFTNQKTIRCKDNQHDAFLNNPTLCEISCHLTLRQGYKSGHVSIAGVFLRALESTSSQKSDAFLEEVRVRILNDDISAIKVKKFEKLGRANKIPVRSPASVSQFSERSQMYENQGTELLTLEAIYDICVLSTHIAFVMNTEKFRSFLQKKAIDISQNPEVWLFVSGLLREKNLSLACKAMPKLSENELAEGNNKRKIFVEHIRKNLSRIAEQHYVNSDLILQWYRCLCELDDNDIFGCFKIPIKLKKDIEEEPLKELCKLIRTAPPGLCDKIIINVEEGVNSKPNITLRVDEVLRENLHSKAIRLQNYKTPWMGTFGGSSPKPSNAPFASSLNHSTSVRRTVSDTSTMKALSETQHGQ